MKTGISDSLLTNHYVDLHIHIGRTEQGRPVKITGAKNLTFYNIAKEASMRKGIEMVGIIDCHSPSVQAEILSYLDSGEMVELAGGGIRYGDTTIILGSEIEVHDPGMGAAHLLVYLPTLEKMQDFTQWLRKQLKNVELSSQRIYATARSLQEEALGRGGMLIPAHIFTPHKGIYGACTDRMANLLDLDGIAAVELGLSADTEMAGQISELDTYTFLTNSDAHSLPKIGREYNVLSLQSPTYEELRKALYLEDGRAVVANYGLNPRLGKYHRTYCATCEAILDEQDQIVVSCSSCGGTKIVRGVIDRVMDIADQTKPNSQIQRPPYHYQVPLEYIPGIGPKKFERLLDHFGTEMNVLHRVPIQQLAELAGESFAAYITSAREGTLAVQAGGGGKYGKVMTTQQG
ncbi:TIGR00375 family protein [Paenibacillus albiflavus]|uniref:TIGR00375 family protein n=1 Tax=Paenibacillus albiflavus TaxID=2545760 RepID=A0A4R4EH45_9BACL|nr:endonuclease Q family protein [Paenibacillus albiflavus]TCZ77488.1 TIGR00375 family protein [Paenibacillus albiflavus]